MRKIASPRRLITKRWSRLSQLGAGDCENHFWFSYFGPTSNHPRPTSHDPKSLLVQPTFTRTTTRNVDNNSLLAKVRLNQAGDDRCRRLSRPCRDWPNIAPQSSWPRSSETQIIFILIAHMKCGIDSHLPLTRRTKGLDVQFLNRAYVDRVSKLPCLQEL